jgi:NAD(P)-dependent dehydrogenase (short-subunit alcohol dehydrogenase family)
MGRLDGKVAIVTGGAGIGIGGATTRKLAAEGASVIIADIAEALCESLVEELTGQGLQVASIRCDVNSPDDLKAAVDLAHTRFGSLDILHNHAIGRPIGKFPPGPRQWKYLHELSPEVWDSEIRSVLSAAFYAIHAALPAMLAGGGGSIINTTSAAAYGGNRGSSAYSSAKAGVAVLTYCVANEYGASNIRCNAVAPGITGANGRSGVEISGYDTLEEYTRQQAIQRVVEESEVANLVAFLASDEASGITGAVIPADGGYRAGFGNVFGRPPYHPSLDVVAV